MRRPSLLALSLALALPVVGACDEALPTDPAPAIETGAIAISGAWAPPQSTLDVAATQYVPVVDPPAISPLGHCTSTNPFACSCTHPACTAAYPGTAALDLFLRQRYQYLSAGGLYCCRQNSAQTSVPKLSVHAIGRAIDLMVPMTNGDADNTKGDPVANWLVENAEYIGIQRVIWDKRYWNGQRGFGLLSSASLPHTNHIHVELSVAGANKQTPFFTSGAYNNSCTAHCEGTLLIKANCSATDCANTGAQCLPGPPPACGAPPPP
ncbi:MAG: hypothetical protein KC635_01905, partial [Myxococcales bacterium]|nr:hypothetical protein [Myxococcales bacterium]